MTVLRAAGIAYVYHGGGQRQGGCPPLLLMHGAGGSHLHWPPAVRREPLWSVYAPDLPGHGDSSGQAIQTISGYLESILAWMDAVGMTRCVWAGHSMGGAIALQAALDHPERVGGLVLLGSGGRLRVLPEILGKTSDGATYAEAVALVVAGSYSPSASPGLVALARKRMLAVPPQVLHSDFMACDGFDVMARLGDIRAPTLVLCGAEDRMTPVRYAQFLAEAIPEACLEVIDRAGHMVMLEQPQSVAEALRRFGERLCAESGATGGSGGLIPREAEP